jgi:hypothetical protein
MSSRARNVTDVDPFGVYMGIQDPDYKIVLAAYPFVTQKLLRDGGDESFRMALNAILYPASPDGVRKPRPSPRRIAALVNNALGRAAVASDSSVMLDLDALPAEENAATLTESIAFLGSDRAGSIRSILIDEIVNGADLIIRSAARRLASSVEGTRSIPLPLPQLPFMPQPRLPILNPLNLIPKDLRQSTLDRVAPILTAEEEIYASDVLELTKTLTGLDVEDLILRLSSPQQLLSALGPAVVTLRQGPEQFRPSEGSQFSAADGSSTELLNLFMPQTFARRESTESPEDQLKADARAALQSIIQQVIERLRVRQSKRLGFHPRDNVA